MYLNLETNLPVNREINIKFVEVNRGLVILENPKHTCSE